MMPQAADTKTSRTKKPRGKSEPILFSPEWYAWRTASIAKNGAPHSLDVGDPQGPVGHEYGIRTTTRLIRNYRELHRREAMDITPQGVIDVLHEAGVRKWMLVGLHGSVGYLSDPPTTQDVDVMVTPLEREKAATAIRSAWPKLLVQEYSEVVRFRDPNDRDYHGHPKPVIDLMIPWREFHQRILNEFVVVDETTQHRIPSLEAALVLKYSMLVSVMREIDKKEQDASEFRRMVKANRDRIDVKALRRLAAQVWKQGADEIERFLEIAMSNEQFVL